jgi:hypothetical protein
MKNYFLLALACIFISCTPRIGTLVTKTYPAESSDFPVEIFMDTKLTPSDSEVLGIISISDTGFSTQCDSATVVEHLKEEARKVGGNAVVVSEHIKPSFWGSSCHQMSGSILRIYDFNSVPVSGDSDSIQLVDIKLIKPDRMLPRITFSANLGYGWRTAPTPSDFSHEVKEYVKGLKSGWTGKALLGYYPTDYYGIGFVYSIYNAHQNAGAYLNSIPGYLDTKDWITFAGPVFLMRLPLNNKKWIMSAGLGLGYMSYDSKATFLEAHPQSHSSINGSTVGSYSDLGIEYLLNDNWGIGFDISTMTGILNQWTAVDFSGHKTTVKPTSNNEREGLGQIHLSVGVRYYIK